jgi:ArsR family transcriptional regulator
VSIFGADGSISGTAVASFDAGAPYHPRVARLTEKDVERISAAIAEPRRFKILKDLGSRERSMTCGAICDKHGVSQATISHHLKALEDAGLIEIVREGKFGNVSLKRDVWDAYVAHLSAL